MSTCLVVIKPFGDADMGPRKIPETHGTMLNCNAEGEVTAGIVIQYMADIVEKLVLILEHRNNEVTMV